MRRRALLALVLLAALAGCGGSGDDDGAPTTTTTKAKAATTTSAAPTTTSTTAAPVTTTTAPPTTTTAPPVRWATADETLRNVLQYWKDGRLDELHHLYEPGVDAPDAGLLEVDPAEFDISDPGTCNEFESKVGGLEAVCDVVLPSTYGFNHRMTVYFVPAREGGYWLLSNVAYAGTEGGM